ncbi:hypothetical protein [Paraburkholderia sediminicola]|uniref:hypothetical protein n=1 Tax=Paraburkholderia sediminicola TaxID=458836 RepID=UPI0038B70BAF
MPVLAQLANVIEEWSFAIKADANSAGQTIARQRYYLDREIRLCRMLLKTMVTDAVSHEFIMTGLALIVQLKRLIAVVWMTIGVMALGHRTLESFPSTVISPEWLRGYRAAFVWFYHLARWPCYMRSPFRDIADRIGRWLFKWKKSPHHSPEHLPEKPSGDGSEEGGARNAHRDRQD